MMGLAVVALVAAIVRGNRREILAAGVLAAFILSPVLGFGVSLGVAIWAVTRRRSTSSDPGDDEAVLAELTSLGLSAGLTFSAAANAAATAVPTATGASAAVSVAGRAARSQAPTPPGTGLGASRVATGTG